MKTKQLVVAGGVVLSLVMASVSFAETSTEVDGVTVEVDGVSVDVNTVGNPQTGEQMVVVEREVEFDVSQDDTADDGTADDGATEDETK
jgi:hypothetical protein